MVLFWPIQQELDCINASGDILGKIKFNGEKECYQFFPNTESVALSNDEQTHIAIKLAALESGQSIIPMQDDD